MMGKSWENDGKGVQILRFLVNCHEFSVQRISDLCENGLVWPAGSAPTLEADAQWLPQCPKKEGFLDRAAVRKSESIKISGIS